MQTNGLQEWGGCVSLKVVIDFGRREGIRGIILSGVMMRPLLCAIFLFGSSALLSSCGTFSTDPAPGGITNPHTGMDAYSAAQWQNETIRRLAY